ncbi:hypothetical protein Poli38472_009565 [Pythium oligandrum]|uniref:Uncharacterized protein n=1 Tax=Pythium oligandrum TaxID=41045 RepID=A0A8K1FJQ9_PYTOL|nr:hypothetical protein Poli38472_009565 [Pythium oligandrum]|eukprot:TMW62072.1 hypothetical protein Poli38472_009565 [Pythium oligandrum]
MMAHDAVKAFYAASELLLAARNGRVDAVERLVKSGVSVNASNAGDSAFSTAFARRHTRVYRFLAGHGADVDHPVRFDVEGKAQHAPAVVIATIEQNAPLVRFLVENGADVNANVTDNRATALSWAAWRGDLDMTKLLLSLGARISRSRYKEVSEELGAHPKQARRLQRTLLMVEDGQMEATAWILMAIACGQQHKTLAGYLWKHYEDGLRSSPLVRSVGVLALSFAVENQDWELIDRLLKTGVPVNGRCEDGSTAAHAAIGVGSLDLLKFLVSCGANVVSTSPNMAPVDRSALRHAVYHGHVDVMRYLLSFATSSFEQLRVEALSMAVQAGQVVIAQDLLYSSPSLISLSTLRRMQLIDVAVTIGSVEVVAGLLDRVEGIQQRDLDAALSKASLMGHDSLVSLLLAYGADVNSTNKFGMRLPLHAAADRVGPTFQNVVDILLRHGSDTLECDSFGETPLDAARRKLSTLRDARSRELVQGIVDLLEQFDR